MADPYTVLHGGFHKTASTFLQQSLQRNKGKLRKGGVHYIEHRHLRKEFTVPCQRNAVWEMGLPRKTVIDNEMLRQMTTAYFKPLVSAPPDRLILSDENLAGHCGNCVKHGKLYQFRKEFISAFAKELPFPVHEIYFAVRNYADFFAGAYIEYCRSLQANGPPFVSSRKMCTRVFNHMPGWNGVINVVSRQFPHAKIFVWRFEDFVANDSMAPALLQRIVGDTVQVQDFHAPRGKSQRQSASARATHTIEKLALTEGLSALVAQRQDIQKLYPRNKENGRFDPWDPWERAHLMRLYDKDMARLSTNQQVTLLTPENLG